MSRLHRRSLLAYLLALGTGLPSLSQGNAPKRWVETASTKRVALVIGNAAYQHGSPLKNPVSDAHRMAESLRDLGFDVILLKDGTSRQMKEAINNFGDKLSADCVAIAYYSGHGIQSDGVNYLLPVDFNAKKRADIEFEGVPAGRILSQFAEKKSAVNIVILDACRNNPFKSFTRSSETGLSKMDAPRGTLIAYATSPGSVADDNVGGANGLYTTALLDELPKPGVKVEDMFKAVNDAVATASNEAQTPWIESSIRGNLYLAKGAALPDVIGGTGSELDTRGRLKVSCNAPNFAVSVGGRSVAGGVYTVNLLEETTATITVRVTAPGYEGKLVSATLERGKVLPLAVTLAVATLPPDVPITGGEFLTYKGHNDVIATATFSPDGRRVVTASYDNTAQIWDANTGKTLLTLNGHSELVASAVFSPDGRRVVTASGDKTAKIWDAATGKVITTLTGHSRRLYTAAFSPDGRRVVTASDDKTARVWDVGTKKTLLTLSGRIHSAAFSPNGRRILTSGQDNTAKIWDVATGEVVATLKGGFGDFFYASFSPNGKRVVTANYDHTARIWDVATGRSIQTLRGHRSYVFTAVFSPDGRRIVTASADGTAKVWDVATNTLIATFKGHDNWFIFAAFSPDGKRIVTTGKDKTAKIWLLK